MSIEESRAALHEVASDVDDTQRNTIAPLHERQQELAQTVGALSAQLAEVITQLQGTVSESIGETAIGLGTTGSELQSAEKRVGRIVGRDPLGRFDASRSLLRRTGDSCERASKRNFRPVIETIVRQLLNANDMLFEFHALSADTANLLNSCDWGAHAAAQDIRDRADEM